ncbi:MAG: copper-containing nitrite reductase, partial [Methanobacteriota archaeon]
MPRRILLWVSLAIATVAGCTSAPPPAPDDGPAGGVSTHVEMMDLKFAPATITVAVGATVTWTNHEVAPHTVTTMDPDRWGTPGSGDETEEWLAEGESWSFKFTEPGTYRYRCLPHSTASGAGMVGTVIVTGDGVAPAAEDDAAPTTTVVPDPRAPARSLPDADGVVRVSLETREVAAEFADGVGYTFWTFDGTVPGPMLRVRQGDTVELTLTNAGNSTMPHSIDLHAVSGPGGGAVLTQTPPGGTSTFRFEARNPGLYMYHCATPHVPTHIANGMYGLILVEPREGLPPVDREYFVVQGEIYPDGALGEAGMHAFDLGKLLEDRPEYFLMNGRVGALAGSGALTARTGETVRIYFGVGGFVASNFHVIGEVFDRVYAEGGFPPREHVQTTLVPAGGATIVEFEVDAPGTHLLVDHALSRAIDRGAVGTLEV